MTRRKHPPAFAMGRAERRRFAVMVVGVTLIFGAVASQMSLHALTLRDTSRTTPVDALARAVARPDIVDRQGRLIATDLVAASAFANPKTIQGVDETAEALSAALPGLDVEALRAALADDRRGFLWIKRRLTPEEEKRVLDLGLPGVGFRREPSRVYPIGRDGAQTIGFVDIENRGASGIERWIDDTGRAEPVDGPGRVTGAPVALSLDLGVQHALRDELRRAQTDYRAEAAAGLVLDVRTGEVLAASSLPDFRTGDAAASLAPEAIDRLAIGVYELGSVFKSITLAAAHEAGMLTPGRQFDARSPIQLSGQQIDDLHPRRQLLSAEEVFLFSSNIGTARMADELGEVRLRSILARLGLTEPLTTELGVGPRPLLPNDWQRLSSMTIGYGHGIAVTPLQFATAMARLVNGNRQIVPTFLKRDAHHAVPGEQAVPDATVRFLRALLRANVVRGTGRLADVPGYAVGGKTGTADLLGKDGYQGAGVLTSFLAVFPAHEPRYLSLVLLWRPQATPASGGERTAGRNAAPATGRLIRRIAPLLGLAPELGDEIGIRG